MLDWFKKRRMLKRWQIMCWSLICIFAGFYMSLVELNIYEWSFISIGILWGGWDLLFSKNR